MKTKSPIIEFEKEWNKNVDENADVVFLRQPKKFKLWLISLLQLQHEHTVKEIEKYMKKDDSLINNGSVENIIGLLSISSAAKLLEVSTETLRRWDRSGKFKAVRIGKRRKYRKIDILKIMNK